MIVHSLVPDAQVTVHIVLDDLGELGRAYRETDEARTALRTLIEDMLNGEFTRPKRIVAFNTDGGWSRDVSEDVARDVMEKARSQKRSLPSGVQDFVGRVLGSRSVKDT